MSAGCGFKCAKATLFGLNFVLWVASLALLGAGIWMRASPHFLEQQGVSKLESDAISLSSGGIILIAVAAICVMLGFFGCCGTAKESQCMLGIYVTFLLTILLFQLIAAALGIFSLTVFKNEVEAKIKTNMKNTLQEKYGLEGHKQVTEMWDLTQYEARCCGTNGPQDFKDSTWYATRTNKTEEVPVSCCMSDDGVALNAALCQEEATKVFNNETVKQSIDGLSQEGCYEAIKHSMTEYSKILIGTSIGVAILELFCFILGVFICCNVGKYSYDYE